MMVLIFFLSFLFSHPSFAGVEITSAQFLEDNQLPQVQLISGYQANPDKHGSESKCTGVLIGPRVVVTAGHCPSSSLGLGKRTTFGPIDGKTYRFSAVYEPHPLYKTPHSFGGFNIPHDMAVPHDVAVGILTRDVVGITPVSVSNRVPLVGERVLFAGVGEPYFPSRQYGFASVITVSPIGITLRGAVPPQGVKPSRMLPFQELQAGGPGDSGGPSFLLAEDGSVTVFAVTSSSTGISDLSMWWREAIRYTMGVTRLIEQPDQQSESSSGEKVSFLEMVVKKHGVEICGINLECDPVHFNRSSKSPK